VTTFAELAAPTIDVTPGEEATTALLVRNDSEIVEAYEFEVVGDLARWTFVEPSRLTLYPGTSESVLVVLRVPRTPEVRAGDVPLGVRVLPVERPQTATVAETTVHIGPFWQLRTDLAPRRRRGWRSARYQVGLRNGGNVAMTVGLTAIPGDDQLRLGLPARAVPVGPGELGTPRIRVSTRGLIWFGKPVTRTFQLAVAPVGAPDRADPAQLPARVPAGAGAPGRWAPDAEVAPATRLDGEFVQLAILPRWLLALLAAILALLLAWFALVRPTVRSAAREAADDRATQLAAANSQAPPSVPPAPAVTPPTRPAPPAAGGAPAAGGGGGGAAPAGLGAGAQSSATITVNAGTGRRVVGRYAVPARKILRITDIVIANPQGDEGVVTIVFGSRVITVIALETFRNQDYHWVTPIDVPAGQTVRADVTCGRPGTPASGRQAAACLEVLNVNGELVAAAR
jgi:hypothetical protein